MTNYYLVIYLTLKIIINNKYLFQFSIWLITDFYLNTNLTQLIPPTYHRIDEIRIMIN